MLLCIPFWPMRLRQFLRSSPLSAASASTQFDYLAHVRHIDQVRNERGREYSFWPVSNSLSTEESGYLMSNWEEAELQCQLDGVTVSPEFSNLWNLKNDSPYFLHAISLLRETTWALAAPILNQLESLTIPLSDIRQYHAVIDRLGRLESIRILQDEIYQYGDTIGEVSRVRRDEAMQAMVLFVEAHARCHPGRLKDVSCETNAWRNGVPLYFPDEIKLQVYRALPPPTKRTILNGDNCLPVLAHPQIVDLGHVEAIYQEWDRFRWLEKAVREDPRFLQKCRRLRNIRMYSLGRGSFDWAVRERRSIDDDGYVTIEDTDNSDTNNNSDNDTNNEHRVAVLPLLEGCFRLQQQRSRGRIVPVESMRLYKTTYDREIDDIAFAFSRTLESLTVGAFLRMRGSSHGAHLYD